MPDAAKEFPREKWETEDELLFLQHLGAHRWLNIGNSQRKPADAAERLDLLRNYLAGIPDRSKWGFIDKEEVSSFVVAEIARLLAGGVTYDPPLDMEKENS